MEIILIEPLLEKDAALLAKIGVTTKGLSIVIPDEYYTYCKTDNDCYNIYSYDNKNPVAELTIRRGSQFSSFRKPQVIHVHKSLIEAALERKATMEKQGYPDYIERKKRFKERDYYWLFNIPFSELEYDEKRSVESLGFKYQDNDKYYPLSKKGSDFVSKIRSLTQGIDSLTDGRYFAELKKANCFARASYLESDLNSIKNRSHDLTQEFSEEQVSWYFDIARTGIAPYEFQELEPATALVNKYECVDSIMSSNHLERPTIS